jgi:leader peptidase (prepilin peptidase) / N-methyltransferase
MPVLGCGKASHVTALLLVVVTLLGLLAGSFLTTVIDRVPSGQSVVRPRSRCRTCGHPVRNRHNIPVVGWVVLKGRCADCGTRTGLHNPLLEAGTAALFIAITRRLADGPLLSALPAYLYFAALGIALSVIDLEHHRLPDALVLPAYPVLAVLLTASSAARHDWSSLGRAAVGAVVLFGCYLALALVHPRGMGFGDVKLAGVVGGALAYLSWSALVVGALGAFVLGAVTGVAMMAAGRAGRTTAIPFGPFMIVGAVTAMFAAGPIAEVYLALLRAV